MQFSLTLQGLAVLVIGTILKATGEDLADPKLAEWVALTCQIAGAVISYYGRYRQGDVTWYGAKKSDLAPVEPSQTIVKQ